MRTKMLLVVVAVFLCLIFNQSNSHAQFLVSDPQTDATSFRIRLSADNGATWGAWSVGPPVSNAMRFDLSGYSAGTYQGQAQAGLTTSVTDTTTGVTTTSTAWSASSPFGLRTPSKVSPKAIRVIDGN
jgi:hypothetical protein